MTLHWIAYIGWIKEPWIIQAHMFACVLFIESGDARFRAIGHLDVSILHQRLVSAFDQVTSLRATVTKKIEVFPSP